MKKHIVILLSVFITLMAPIPSYAHEISIIIAKQDFVFYHLDCTVDPILVDDKTLAPLREISEEFHFNVFWDDFDQSIIVSKEEIHIKFWIGNNRAIVNGEELFLHTAPRLLNDKTMIPIRDICEMLNIKVFWKQGVESKAFIWLSEFDLLTEEDIMPNENFYKLDTDIPFYCLNSLGETNRGIKIGDSYERVLALYGMPHQHSHNVLKYYTPYSPNSSDGSTLIFHFQDEKVTSVEIDF